MSFHRQSIGLEVHVPHSFTYADETARVAAVSTDFTDPDDLFKLARQTSDITYWVLEQITPSVTWNQLGGGGGASELPFDAITDPAVDAAVTTAIIDVNSGTVITLTAAGNSQTLAAPTVTTAGRKFFVLNNDTSNNNVVVNGASLSPGNYIEFRWDGTAWLATAGGVAGPGGSDSQVQYNNSGVLAGDANHTWDDVAKRQRVLGDIVQTGGETGNLYTPTIVFTSGVIGTSPRNATVQANYLYVVDSTDDTLSIFDVTDPFAPAIVNTPLAIGGGGRGVDVVGRYCYINTQDNLFVIVDVQDKSNPVVVSSLNTGVVGRGVKVQGSIAVLSNNVTASAAMTVDVSDPASPVILDTLSIASMRAEMDVVGNVAFMVTSVTDDLVSIDISDPSNISVLQQFQLVAAVATYAVRVQGRYAYVAEEDCLRIFDVVDPTNMLEVSLLLLDAGGSSARTLNVSGNFCYILDALNNVMYVVDVSDPLVPVHIANPLTIGTNPLAIATVGRFAYVMDNTDDNFQVIDVRGIDAQNVNAGNVDAGNINVRRDVKLDGVISAGGGAVLGPAGLNSDGPVISKTHLVASAESSVVEIFNENDFPDVAGIITPAPGVTYEVMNPITLTKKITHPTTVSGFDPAVIRTSAKYANIVSVQVASGSMLETSSGAGQIVFQNIRLESDGTVPFAIVSGSSQTSLLTELDDCDLVGFAPGSTFTTCILNINNGAFWTGSGTFKLVDAECNIADAFNANFSDTALPSLRVQSSAPGAGTISFLAVRDSKLSSQATESFFMLHSNLVAGSTMRLNGIEKSPFTPGTGAFFASETGSIASLANSPGAPGVRTLVNAAGHTVADGDSVTQSGFATQTQNNGTFVASSIVAGVSYEIIVVFVATDTGTWTNLSLDQTDPKVLVRDSPEQADSKTIGSCHANSNATVTVIATLNTYTDLDLGGNALGGSNIERWSLTNTTTGELTYNGIEPFSGTVFAQLSTLGEAGSPEYRFRAVKNGVALADGIETVREAGAVQIVTTGLVAPVSVVTGDTIRLQVNNIDDASDITIAHLSVSIQ